MKKTIGEPTLLKIIEQIAYQVDFYFYGQANLEETVVVPSEMISYRSEEWFILGRKNLIQLLKSITLSKDPPVSKKIGYELVNNLLKVSSGIEQSNTYTWCLSKAENIFIFDSFYFFNGGHLAVLEETLDLLASQNDTTK